MPPERKTVMISARLPAALVERVDYVVRNSPVPAVDSRSTAVQAALESWTDTLEETLRGLGVLPKKARP